MLREILTLYSEEQPLKYYIMFERSRTKFSFQPTYKNKAAPSFEIYVLDGKLVLEGVVNPSLGKAAMEKVRDILSNMIFDHL